VIHVAEGSIYMEMILVWNGLGYHAKWSDDSAIGNGSRLLLHTSCNLKLAPDICQQPQTSMAEMNMNIEILG
jgi:hypothetical protein